MGYYVCVKESELLSYHLGNPLIIKSPNGFNNGRSRDQTLENAWMQLLVVFDLFYTQQHMQLLCIHGNSVYMGKLAIAR